MRAVALHRHSQFSKCERGSQTPERVVAAECHSHTLIGWTLTQRSRIRAPVPSTATAYPQTSLTATPSHSASHWHANTRLAGVAAFLGRLRGWKLVPATKRCLVPPGD